MANSRGKTVVKIDKVDNIEAETSFIPKTNATHTATPTAVDVDDTDMTSRNGTKLDKGIKTWELNLRLYCWGMYLLLFITMSWNCSEWKDLLGNVIILSVVRSGQLLAGEGCTPPTTSKCKTLRHCIAVFTWVFITLIGLLGFVILNWHRLENTRGDNSYCFEIIPCNLLYWYPIPMLVIDIMGGVSLTHAIMKGGYYFCKKIVKLLESRWISYSALGVFTIVTPVTLVLSGYLLYKLGFDEEGVGVRLFSRICITTLAIFWGTLYVPIVMRKGVTLIIPLLLVTGLMLTVASVSLVFHRMLASARTKPNWTANAGADPELIRYIQFPNPFNGGMWSVYFDRPDMFFFGNDTAVWVGGIGFQLIYLVNFTLIFLKELKTENGLENVKTGFGLGACAAFPLTLGTALMLVLPFYLGQLPIGLCYCSKDDCNRYCNLRYGNVQSTDGQGQRRMIPFPYNTGTGNNGYNNYPTRTFVPQPTNGGHPWWIPTNQHGNPI